MKLSSFMEIKMLMIVLLEGDFTPVDTWLKREAGTIHEQTTSLKQIPQHKVPTPNNKHMRCYIATI